MLGEPAADRSRAVVLLTDGLPDPNPEQQRAQLSRLAGQAAASGVTVYALGLGQGYDRDLLLRIASATRSPLIWKVQAPRDLTAAFLEVLRGLKGFNVLTVPEGGVDLSTLASQAVLVSLGPRGRPAPADLLLPDGRRVAGAAGAAGDRVRYRYDRFAIPTPPAGRLRYPGEVVWLVEQPGLAVEFLAPTQREGVPAGEPVPVRLLLSPCGSGPLPPVTVQVQVLDSGRNPTGQAAELRPDPAGPPGTFAGTLQIGQPGEYLLTARVSAAGRQMAQVDVTVQAAEQDRWTLAAPPAAGSFSPVMLAVTHRRGGRPAAAPPPTVTATLPDGGTADILLAPGRAAGEWTGEWSGHRGQAGEITFRLSGTDLTAVTRIEPVTVTLDPPAAWAWDFWSAWRRRPQTVTVTASATADLPPEALPAAGPAALPLAGASGPWARVAPGRYAAELALTPVGDLRLNPLVAREFRGSLAPAAAAPGIIMSGAVPATARVQPLVPWWLVLGLAAFLLAAWIGFRLWLGSGPQLRAWVVGPGGARLDLLADRRWQNRARNRRSVIIGGPESGAELTRNWLAAGTRARVEALPPAGREQYRLTNLTPGVPMTRDGLPCREVIFGDRPQQVEWAGVRVTLRRR